MRIILAGPRGFCAGVNMAIESLQKAIDLFGTPVYVYHEIVHNRWVVDDFRRKGAIFVNSLDEVPENAHLLYSAHGVSRAIRKQATKRRLKTIDATCPLVTKIHNEVAKYAKQGYTIILIGHEGHDEVVGTMGEAPGSIILTNPSEQIDKLEVPNPGKIAYITQTTLSSVDARRIIGVLRKRFPKIVGPPKESVCYATQNRQEAVRKLSLRVNMTLVIGSPNSSNSKRLAELAGSCWAEAHLVDGPDDIDLSWFSGDETILVTAGASAPEYVVQACVRLLQDKFNATVESKSICEENVKFLLPKELRTKNDSST